MQSISLFTPFVPPPTCVQTSKSPVALPKPIARDSFQRFSGLSSAEAKRANWEATQNPQYVSAKNWANSIRSAERRKLLQEDDDILTDYALAALLQLEEEVRLPKQLASPPASVVRSPSQNVVVSPDEIIVAAPQKATSPQPQISVSSILKSENYHPFDVKNPRRRALPDVELSRIPRELRIACVKHELENELVSASSNSGQRITTHAYSKRQNAGYRWGIGDKVKIFNIDEISNRVSRTE